MYCLPVIQKHCLINRHNSTDIGLPDNIAEDIPEDSKGNLWFATENGMSKYDADRKGESPFKDFSKSIRTSLPAS